MAAASNHRIQHELKQYCLVALKETTAQLDGSFSRLPYDQYRPGAGCHRRWSKVVYSFDTNSAVALPQVPIKQSKSLNGYNGGVIRHYEAVESATLSDPFLLEAIRTFASLVAQGNETENRDPSAFSKDFGLTLHQIRIVAAEDSAGHPVPEGIHQDGHDFVGITVVRRENVTGGITFLHESKDAPAFLNMQQPEQHLLFLNDRALFHNVSSIQRSNPHAEGYRDIFIMAPDDGVSTSIRAE